MNCLTKLWHERYIITWFQCLCCVLTFCIVHLEGRLCLTYSGHAHCLEFMHHYLCFFSRRWLFWGKTDCLYIGIVSTSCRTWAQRGCIPHQLTPLDEVSGPLAVQILMKAPGYSVLRELEHVDHSRPLVPDILGREWEHICKKRPCQSGSVSALDPNRKVEGSSRDAPLHGPNMEGKVVIPSASILGSQSKTHLLVRLCLSPHSR